MKTCPRLSLASIFPTTMRVESGSAIRADDPEVLDPVVRGDPVYVVENQRHLAPSPLFPLPTEFTAAQLDAFVVEAAL
jgi:hypothetical protein